MMTSRGVITLFYYLKCESENLRGKPNTNTHGVGAPWRDPKNTHDLTVLPGGGGGDLAASRVFLLFCSWQLSELLFSPFGHLPSADFR